MPRGYIVGKVRDQGFSSLCRQYSIVPLVNTITTIASAYSAIAKKNTANRSEYEYDTSGDNVAA
ncbi:MAG: hypothetical protein QG549_204 [Patescibacteria group bacterium]|nr:hypothetical protein [Patescibacteria group bacterium]